MMDSTIIFISAQESTHVNIFELGDAYDARILCFRDKNVFNPPPVPDSPMEVKKTELRYFWDDNKLDVISNIDTSPDLKINLGLKFLGSVGIKPFFTNNMVHNQKTLKATLFLSYRTVVESMKKDSLNINEKALSQKDITHYIRSRHYGANVQIHFEHAFDSSETVSNIKGELDATLLKLFAKGSLDYKTNNNNSQLKFTVSIEGDIEMPKEYPTTVEELRNFINKEVPQLIKQNNGKGIIIGYELAPLTDISHLISSPFACLKGRLTEVLYIEIEYCLKKIELLQNLISSTYSDYIDPIREILNEEQYNQLDEVQRKFNLCKHNFKSKIKEGLVSIKSEGEDRGEPILRDVIEEFYSNKIEQEINDFVEQIKSQNEIYIELKRAGAILVEKSSGYEQKLFELSTKRESHEKYKTYVLFYDGKNDINLMFFKKLLSDEQETKEAYFVLENKTPLSTGPTTSRISLYYNGNYDYPIIEDYLKQRNIKKNNYLRPKLLNESNIFERPTEAKILRVPCPNFSRSVRACDGQDREWLCEYCNKKIFIDKNNFVICSCSNYPLKAGLFKCCDQLHGVSFVTFFTDQEADIRTNKIHNINPSLKIFASGDQYEGNFANNIMEGIGKFTWKNGASYSGVWKNNKIIGYGKFIGEEGEEWEGNWQDELFQVSNIEEEEPAELKELIQSLQDKFMSRKNNKQDLQFEDIQRKINSLKELLKLLETKLDLSSNENTQKKRAIEIEIKVCEETLQKLIDSKF